MEQYRNCYLVRKIVCNRNDLNPIFKNLSVNVLNLWTDNTEKCHIVSLSLNTTQVKKRRFVAPWKPSLPLAPSQSLPYATSKGNHPPNF